MTLSNLERLSRCSGRIDGLRLDGLRRRLAMALVLDMAQRRAGTYNSSLSGRVRQKVLSTTGYDGERQRLCRREEIRAAQPVSVHRGRPVVAMLTTVFVPRPGNALLRSPNSAQWPELHFRKLHFGGVTARIRAFWHNARRRPGSGCE